MNFYQAKPLHPTIVKSSNKFSAELVEYPFLKEILINYILDDQ